MHHERESFHSHSIEGLLRQQRVSDSSFVRQRELKASLKSLKDALEQSDNAFRKSIEWSRFIMARVNPVLPPVISFRGPEVP